jgi:CRISPR-associated protein Cas2
MLMLVSYDVSTIDTAGKRRLRRIAKACQNWGVRVQNSVFECNVNSAQWVQLNAELEDIFDPETDSLRYYNLGDRYATRIEHVGAKPSIDVEQPLLL